MLVCLRNRANDPQHERLAEIKRLERTIMVADADLGSFFFSSTFLFPFTVGVFTKEGKVIHRACSWWS